MGYAALASIVLAVHGAFVLFVVAGGALALRWPRAAWAHLPAAAWGAGIELAGGVCPLTPLENQLRRLAGEAGYAGGFVEHYVTAVLYPDGLTRGAQLGLGAAVLLVNSLIYWVLLRRSVRRPDIPPS
jgi:hypothetical protein